jgi:hypothetical protein
MIRLAIAAMLGGWLAAISTGHVRAADVFACYPADEVILDFEKSSEAQIGTAEQAQRALEEMPSLLDGWTGYPLVGAVVFEKANPAGMAFVGLLIGNSVCGAKLIQPEDFRGLRHAVLGLDA